VRGRFDVIRGSHQNRISPAPLAHSRRDTGDLRTTCVRGLLARGTGRLIGQRSIWISIWTGGLEAESALPFTLNSNRGLQSSTVDFRERYKLAGDVALRGCVSAGGYIFDRGRMDCPSTAHKTPESIDARSPEQNLADLRISRRLKRASSSGS
jgi:hypothetical protein